MDRLDLRLTSRPDGAKHHPETGWAPIALRLLKQRTRLIRVITVVLIYIIMPWSPQIETAVLEGPLPLHCSIGRSPFLESCWSGHRSGVVYASLGGWHDTASLGGMARYCRAPKLCLCWMAHYATGLQRATIRLKDATAATGTQPCPNNFLCHRPIMDPITCLF